MLGQKGSYLILPVGLKQQSSGSHGSDLEDVLTDQRNLLKQLLIGRADDSNSIQLSNQNTVILYWEPDVRGQGPNRGRTLPDKRIDQKETTPETSSST